MFGDFGEGSWPGRRALASVAGLPATEQRLLSALRRLALMQPLGAARCQAVHIALQREFGDAGLGLDHLLRCWLVGLSRLAARRLVIGTPACPLLMEDEAVLLGVLRAPDRHGAAALMRLTGNPDAAALLPLFAAVATLTANN